MPDISFPSDPSGKPKRRWRWLRDLLLIVLVIGAVQWWQARDLVKGEAPALVGLLLDGTPYQLTAADGPHLVHFWASWCPVCRFEQDSIDNIAADGRVITIATTSGDAAELTAYMAEHGLRMPVLLDEDGAIARNWGLAGVPATFIVDRQGRIDHASMGYSSEIGLRLRLWLAGLNGAG